MDLEKLQPAYATWGGCKMVQLLWEVVWEFLKRLKKPQLPSVPAILLPGIQLREIKIYVLTKPHTPMFRAAL